MSKKKKGGGGPPDKGPRGGTTTVTESGRVKKNFWFTWEEAEGLRVKAFEDRLSETDLVRRGVRQVLGLPPEEGPAG